MEKLLKQLVGKKRKPLVVDGQLLCINRVPVMVELQHYSICFYLRDKNTEVDRAEGTKLMSDALATSMGYYAQMTGKEAYKSPVLSGIVDNFTGAIVITSNYFEQLLEISTTSDLAQCTAKQFETIIDFTANYTFNYYTVFLQLYSRRLISPQTPMIVRGHLIAGLFQPLEVSSAIISPLVLTANKWFTEIFSSDEVRLPIETSVGKRLELSCVASCDIIERIQFILQGGASPRLRVVKKLDRRHWMFMVTLSLLRQLDGERMQLLVKYYGRIYKELGESEAEALLCADLVRCGDKIKSSIRSVR